MRLTLAVMLLPFVALAQPPLGLTTDFEAGGVRYNDPHTADPIAALQARLRSRDLRLTHDADLGYLPALLRELKIPVSSQGLVFSKTSLQLHKIFPRNPRALYFNDDVYIGYVPGGDVIEISAVDPLRGAIFYTLDQSAAPTPRIERREDCLQCHASPRTLGIPGHLMRSVWTAASGYPMVANGGFVTDDRSPMKERWGGWYVTGTHVNDVHMGNQTLPEDAKPETFDPAPGANLTDVSNRFSALRYLTPHSDVVALMVLGHQTALHNFIARASYETRLAVEQNEAIARALKVDPSEFSASTRRRIERPAEELVLYLLFRNEAPLKGRVTGTSTFARDFARGAKRDRKGRSLRDFDLERRLFRYPCSWLIDSPAFDAMPAVTKRYVYRRIREILGRPGGPPEDRAALEILAQVKPEVVVRDLAVTSKTPQAADSTAPRPSDRRGSLW